MKSRLKPCFKLILTPFIFASTLSLMSCGMFGGSDSEKSSMVIEKELSPPTLSYLVADDELNVDFNDSEDGSEWLAVAQKLYNEKRYARALRAAEASLSISDSEEARKIAMLSTINITQQNMNTYKDNETLGSDEKDIIKDQLTRITTAISQIEYSQTQEKSD